MMIVNVLLCSHNPMSQMCGCVQASVVAGQSQAHLWPKHCEYTSTHLKIMPKHVKTQHGIIFTTQELMSVDRAVGSLQKTQ